MTPTCGRSCRCRLSGPLLTAKFRRVVDAEYGPAELEYLRRIVAVYLPGVGS